MRTINLAKNFLDEEIIVGDDVPVKVIAEAGVLTFGDKDVGFKFVDEAKRVGIDLLKFQSFIPENVVSTVDKFWLERLKQRALSLNDFLEIMEYGKEKGVLCFASTHNEYDLVALAEAGMPVLKIGSGDSNNFRMIDMALDTGKPVILSLGLLKKQEIDNLLNRYKKYSNQLIILHCTTIYPTPIEQANLGVLKYMKKKFPEFIMGYSDHVKGHKIALAAAGLEEVNLIEKHICFPEHRTKPKFESLDIPVALTPEEFSVFLSDIEDIETAFGDNLDNSDIYQNKKWAQKAICARRDIVAGKKIEKNDLMSIRPFIKEKGHIPINNFYDIAGRQVRKKIKKTEYLLNSDFDL